MSAKPNYFKLGIFIIGAIVLALAAVVILGAGKLFSHKLVIETYLDQSAQGLDIGSKVKFRGVTVGNISRIDFVQNLYPPGTAAGDREKFYIVLEMEITKPFITGLGDAAGKQLAYEVSRGLRARLTSQGVTGTAYLEINYVDPDRFPPMAVSWAPHHPYIPSAEGTLTRIVSSAEQIFAQLQRVDFEKIGTNTSALLANLNESSARLLTLLNDSKFHHGLDDAGVAMDKLRKFMESPEVSDSLAHLQKLLVQADQLISGKDADVQATLQNLRVLTENLRAVSENARSYPSQILFGNPPPSTKLAP